jgi:hypothetical protein
MKPATITPAAAAAASHQWIDRVAITNAMRAEAARELAECDPEHIEETAIRCNGCQALKVYSDRRRPRGNSRMVYYRNGGWWFRMGVCIQTHATRQTTKEL